MTWTLIVLAIYGTAPSQVAVPGFASKALCTTAAAAYVEGVEKGDPKKQVFMGWVCVPMAAA